MGDASRGGHYPPLLSHPLSTESSNQHVKVTWPRTVYVPEGRGKKRRLVEKLVNVDVEFPMRPPTDETHRGLTVDVGSPPWTLICPGCTDGDVALGRCHGTIIRDYLRDKFTDRIPPVARGMQGNQYRPEGQPNPLIALLDGERSYFIGRRPPRGVATVSDGVKTTLSRSPYANPFIVVKDKITLGESLALYRYWLVDKQCNPLSVEEMMNVAAGAEKLPVDVADPAFFIYYQNRFP